MTKRQQLWYEDDDYLLGLVARTLHPALLSRDTVEAAGRAAFTWRTVDVELAECLAPHPAGRSVID